MQRSEARESFAGKQARRPGGLRLEAAAFVLFLFLRTVESPGGSALDLPFNPGHPRRTAAGSIRRDRSGSTPPQPSQTGAAIHRRGSAGSGRGSSRFSPVSLTTAISGEVPSERIRRRPHPLSSPDPFAPGKKRIGTFPETKRVAGVLDNGAEQPRRPAEKGAAPGKRGTIRRG